MSAGERMIPGGAELVAWFGYWPTFRDAEVLSIEVARSGTSRVVVQAWEITPEIDSMGRYVRRKETVVRFLLEGVSDLELAGFNHQNVLTGLHVEIVEEGYRLALEGIYGVDGFVTAESVRIELGV